MTEKMRDLSQEWLQEFDLIRSFHDKEVFENIQDLLSKPDLTMLLQQFLPTPGEKKCDTDAKSAITGLLGQVKTAKTTTEFQHGIRDHLLPAFFSAFNEITITGLTELNPNLPYLYISNHRDIVLDPLLLLSALDQHHYQNAHSAIGDNLLRHPISDKLAKLNRCFSVFRSITSPKAAFKAMKVQSCYIRYIHFNQGESVWIAQKEGRAKDGIDTTNPALIKMLSLARPKDMSLGQYMSQLKIVPVSFSYEWDPCDIEKAKELTLSRGEDNYQKSSLDDLQAVRKGLVENKGRVNVHFDSDFCSKDIAQCDHQDIARLIDQSISQHYFIHNNIKAARFILDTDNALTMPLENLMQSSDPAIHHDLKELMNRVEHLDNEMKKRVLQTYAAPLREQEN